DSSAGRLACRCLGKHCERPDRFRMTEAARCWHSQRASPQGTKEIVLPSHHPLLAVLAEAHFILYGWLRSGNCGTARGVVEFLKEALAFLPAWLGVRLVRADAGFFDQKLLAFLEERGLRYIVVARLTAWLKREAARVPSW